MIDDPKESWQIVFYLSAKSVQVKSEYLNPKSLILFWCLQVNWFKLQTAFGPAISVLVFVPVFVIAHGLFNGETIFI